MAKAGVTALAGQVLTLDGNPLAGVTLQVGNKKTRSDASGRFLVDHLQGGKQSLWIEGASANHDSASFGAFDVGVSLRPGITNALSYTVWMPRLDTAHAVTIASPTTAETVIKSPLVPGLELHLPAGTVIKDWYGKVVHTISITPVPLDRPVFPLPLGVQVPIYFTIQPGGSYISNISGKYEGGWLIYPNPSHHAPGTRFDFWNYDPSPAASGWFVYGHGSVGKDGTSVVPDAGVQIYGFTGAMVGGPSLGPSPSPAPPPNSCPPSGSPKAGDPVDCSTGLFIESHTDLSLKDVLPITFTRTYRTADTRSRPFGIGATDNYEIFLVGDNSSYTYLDVILPDGARVYYPRVSGTTFSNGVFENTSAPGRYYGSIITYRNSGWTLKLRDGTVYIFPDSFLASNPALAAVTSITDRYGNKVTISRDSSGNITQIMSPNGRWLQFQHDANNRITQITDDIGRTVTYTYDSYSATGRPSCNSTGMLCAVTDANGGVTSYTYDSSDRMLTMTDPRGNTVFTNQYDTAGRVSQQTLADGASTWQFSYTLDSNGNVTQTAITDPRGMVEQKNFQEFYDSGSSNYTGFLSSDVEAVGRPEQQTTTYTRDPSTNLVSSMTDQLGRVTSYTYDSMGNLTGVTRLAGTSNAVTTSYSYDSTYNQLTSVTDPLSHTWTLSRDGQDNLTGITDPLGHTITLSYNGSGQPLTIADAGGDTAHFGYSFGDLISVTDPAGNTSDRFTDGAGRTVSVIDPLGDISLFTYDPLDRLTQVTDANGGTTKFGYDGDGNLLTVTDANNNQTTYTYDSRNRRLTRTDALGKADSYAYDANGNLTQYTDRRGKITVYQCDGLNRRTFVGFGRNGSNYESTINYTWDGGNRMTQGVDSVAGTIARTYDGLDRLTEEQTPTSATPTIMPTGAPR